MLADIPLGLQLAAFITLLLLGIASASYRVRRRAARLSASGHPMCAFDAVLVVLLALGLMLLGSLITYVFFVLPS